MTSLKVKGEESQEGNGQGLCPPKRSQKKEARLKCVVRGPGEEKGSREGRL